REKMETHLYEKYGEEFVVDRIGQRSSRDDVFYQARIYPKSIIGTNRQWDNYYYGELSMEIERDGLGGIADTYGEISRSLEIEDLLMPKTEELFGNMVRLKVDQRYQKRNPNGYFISFLNPTLEEVFENMEQEPENHRLLLDLDVYIFKRIENEAEKEERREQIFEFVQYLKKVGLFDYLELGVIFIDERVLAPSYDDFAREIRTTREVREVIEGELVRMPPRELRGRMSIELQNEVEEMSEEELLASMYEIRKDELNYDDLRKNHGQYYTWIYSLGMLESRYRSSITEEDKDRKYDNIDDIRFSVYREYIYY
ncbi:hypothetical protein, partial [Natronospora cellulosivora (SeqCode)]